MITRSPSPHYASRIALLALCWTMGTWMIAAQAQPRVGVWELNLERSKFTPGPAPRKQTLTFRAAGPQWVALIQGIDASGKPLDPDMSNLAITFDGKDHPTATIDYETTAWTLVDARRYTVTRKRAGKVVLTSVNDISEDGHTMTIATTGVNAAGHVIDDLRVYERR